MNFSNINQKLEKNDIVLKPISESDVNFINGLFNDSEIKKYYIVPKEARQDYRRLAAYWLDDIRNGAGTCWIIIKKGNGLFARDNQIGFVAFEFRDTLTNARVSYAILPEYRRKGFATSSLSLVIERLKQEGVDRIEADIDRDNFGSEGVVKKLGFTANMRHALFDPEMMRDGEIRMRALWKKELNQVRSEITTKRIPLNATIEEIVPEINNLVQEINSKGQHPKLLVRYFYLLGRIKFLERNYEEAKQAFGQCNMITIHEGLPEIHENYFWFGKIKEASGDKEDAKMYYSFALEKFNANPDYITKAEIEYEMNK